MKVRSVIIMLAVFLSGSILGFLLGYSLGWYSKPVKVQITSAIETPMTTLAKSELPTADTRFHKIGDSVDCPNIPLRMTILSVAYPEMLMYDDGLQGDKPEAGKMFVMLDVLLENTDDNQPVNIIVSAFNTMQDEEGYTYTPEDYDWTA